MDRGPHNKPMQRWLSAFLHSAAMPSLTAWVNSLAHRWPHIPWLSARIEIRETPDGTSIRRVYGKLSEPLSPAALAESDLPITCLIPEQRMLRQVLQLPNVPAKNLPALLAHEVSRHTPFTAEQVSFTWRVAPKLADASGLAVTLWVLPLTQWQQWRASQPIDPSRVSRIDAVDAQGLALGINLLPKPELLAYWAPRLQRFALMVTAALVLLVIGMLRILHNREADVARWQEQVSALEQEVRPVRLLKARLNQQQRTQTMLSDLHRQSPSRVLILDELTQCLPKDTVLDRLSISGTALSLDGLARSPEALIPALACAKWLKAPRLVGTLQADSTSGLQRFSLQAELIGRGSP